MYQYDDDDDDDEHLATAVETRSTLVCLSLSIHPIACMGGVCVCVYVYACAVCSVCLAPQSLSLCDPYVLMCRVAVNRDEQCIAATATAMAHTEK